MDVFCRLLRLEQTGLGFLILAGPSLQELSFQHNLRISKDELDRPYLATLTALTRVELQEVDLQYSKDVAPLRDLGLLELKLKDCHELAEALIVPGAFTALRKLHLERTGSLQALPTAFQLRSTVFTLPSLSQIVEREYFTFPIPSEELRGWSLDETYPHAGIASSIHTWNRAV